MSERAAQMGEATPDPTPDPEQAVAAPRPQQPAQPERPERPERTATSRSHLPAVFAARPSPGVMTAIAVLLTFGSGATDVASFTRLGNVFTSVMTGNIVLLGLAAARGSVSIAAHTAVSFAGYVIGVAVAARITHASRSNPGDDTAWPTHVTATLILELVLLAAFAAGWEVTDAAPTGAAQFPLLAIAAAAMGIQAVAVRGMDLADLSTTYLTGTLTGLIGTLVNLDRRPSPGRRSGGVLLALLAGAGLSGLLIATVPTAVPALPIAALLTVLLLGSGTLRLPRRSVGDN